jgi:hypothetical protein
MMQDSFSDAGDDSDHEDGPSSHSLQRHHRRGEGAGGDSYTGAEDLEGRPEEDHEDDDEGEDNSAFMSLLNSYYAGGEPGEDEGAGGYGDYAEDEAMGEADFGSGASGLQQPSSSSSSAPSSQNLPAGGASSFSGGVTAGGAGLSRRRRSVHASDDIDTAYFKPEAYVKVSRERYNHHPITRICIAVENILSLQSAINNLMHVMYMNIQRNCWFPGRWISSSRSTTSSCTRSR